MKTLAIYEKYSHHWPAIATGSAIMAVLLGIGFMFTNDVLIAGYLRLASFGFFALALLSLLKVKDGRVRVDFTYTEDQGLEIEYKSDKKNILHEAFDMQNVEAIEISNMPNRSIYDDLKTGDRTIRFKRKNSDDWLYLVEIHGRVLAFSNPEAEKAEHFLNRILNSKTENQ